MRAVLLELQQCAFEYECQSPRASILIHLSRVISLAAWQKYIATGGVSKKLKALQIIKKEAEPMKRAGNLFEKICDIDNIHEAIINAARGKKSRRTVAYVLENQDKAAGLIRDMLINKTYKPKPYRTFVIKDGPRQKERTIFCPTYYPDQIIHWALMQVLQPVIMKGMYEFCCGSIPGRGVHYGKRYLEKWLRKDRKHTKYCLKLDIKKYYPHIDNEVLKEQFRRKIKDPSALWLIDCIIDSHAEGLPIGNYTSQWWANFYLQGLDHYIKEELRIKHYLRYMDDMALFSNNKKQLHKARKLIAEYIKPLGLTLKENWQVFRVDERPVDFLGFRFYRNKTTLRRKNSLRIRRRVKRASKKPKPSLSDARAILSYMGWIKHSNSYYFYCKYIKPYVNIKQLKEVVSYASRKHNQAEIVLC